MRSGERPNVTIAWSSTEKKHQFSERSRKQPGTLFVDPGNGLTARGGCVVKTSTIATRFLLALVARPDCIVANNEMIDLLWGDLEDGGPGSTANNLTAIWLQARAALAALGYSSRRVHGRGFVARAATPIN